MGTLYDWAGRPIGSTYGPSQQIIGTEIKTISDFQASLFEQSSIGEGDLPSAPTNIGFGDTRPTTITPPPPPLPTPTTVMTVGDIRKSESTKIFEATKPEGIEEQKAILGAVMAPTAELEAALGPSEREFAKLQEKYGKHKGKTFRYTYEKNGKQVTERLTLAEIRKRLAQRREKAYAGLGTSLFFAVREAQRERAKITAVEAPVTKPKPEESLIGLGGGGGARARPTLTGLGGGAGGARRDKTPEAGRKGYDYYAQKYYDWRTSHKTLPLMLKEAELFQEAWYIPRKAKEQMWLGKKQAVFDMPTSIGYGAGFAFLEGASDVLISSGTPAGVVIGLGTKAFTYGIAAHAVAGEASFFIDPTKTEEEKLQHAGRLSISLPTMFLAAGGLKETWKAVGEPSIRPGKYELTDVGFEQVFGKGKGTQTWTGLYGTWKGKAYPFIGVFEQPDVPFLEIPQFKERIVLGEPSFTITEPTLPITMFEAALLEPALTRHFEEISPLESEYLKAGLDIGRKGLTVPEPLFKHTLKEALEATPILSEVATELARLARIEKIQTYGSVGDYMRMGEELGRTTGDWDVFVSAKDAPRVSQEMFNIFERKYGAKTVRLKGFTVERFFEGKWDHAVDFHTDPTKFPDMVGLGDVSSSGRAIGYGFETRPGIQYGAGEIMSVGEQLSRKVSSSLTPQRSGFYEAVRHQISFKVPKPITETLAPLGHRVPKEILDISAISRFIFQEEPISLGIFEKTAGLKFGIDFEGVAKAEPLFKITHGLEKPPIDIIGLPSPSVSPSIREALDFSIASISPSPARKVSKGIFPSISIKSPSIGKSPSVKITKKIKSPKPSKSKSPSVSIPAIGAKISSGFPSKPYSKMPSFDVGSPSIGPVSISPIFGKKKKKRKALLPFKLPRGKKVKKKPAKKRPKAKTKYKADIGAAVSGFKMGKIPKFARIGPAPRPIVKRKKRKPISKRKPKPIVWRGIK